MTPTPLAIVGRGCVLPGALSPTELWAGVLTGQVWIGDPPDGPLLRGRRPPWSDRGGYVRGFDRVFASDGLQLASAEIDALDPLARWLLHAARAALAEAGVETVAARQRTGAVFGNLLLPSRDFARFAEAVWLEQGSDPDLRRLAATLRPAAESRFMSGLPVQRVACALGLGAGALALDAACASSLYAIKVARDWLEDGRADVVVAGGVNGVDPVFLHYGFHTLHASSPTGTSRPFHRCADGLVPAEGAACVVLKRLEDAERAGDRILAVVRGIGLSNDGGGQSLLTPSADGQEAAMRRAYADGGCEPSQISLIECHATGTPVGDATEIETMRRVFAGLPGPAIGSLKANAGHLLTASGAAGLLKVVAAMEAGVLPPTPGVDDPLPALAGAPLRLLVAAEPWEGGRPRTAAVSSFGFGGNNAHLIVEEWRPPRLRRRPRRLAPPRGDVAVVGLGCVAAGGECRSDFERLLFRGAGTPDTGVHSLSVRTAGLRFPPNDLHQALGQQLAVFQAAQEAVGECGDLPASRTTVLVGMQCDPEIARHLAWQRLPGWAADLGRSLPEGWVERAATSICHPLEASGVIGLLPNLTANRLNNNWDCTGPSFAVSAEELSGLAALDLALRALRAGEVDAAVVGAVDLCCEAVHRAAAEALPAPRTLPGDAAVVLVCKRLADALRDGSRIYAVIEDGTTEDGPALELGIDGLAPRFGHAHAAAGLLHVAAATLSCHRRALPDGTSHPWLPRGDRPRAAVGGEALGGAEARIHLRAEGTPEPLASTGTVPRMHVFAAEGHERLIDAVRAGRESDAGSARLVIVAAGEEEFAGRRDRALALLEARADQAHEAGLHLHIEPIEGELAFVFTPAATAYKGMGRELLLAFPDIFPTVTERFGSTGGASDWIFAPDAPPPSPLEQLVGSSLLCQVHADLSQRVLALRPAAAIGLSAGETNALAAMGARSDMGALLEDLRRHELYSRELGGEFAAVRRAWGLPEDATVRWSNWRLLRPVAEVRAALAGESRVHVTMIHTDSDCVIGGEAAACLRVLNRLGGGGGTAGAVRLDYDLAIHCPEASQVAELWRAIHRQAAVPLSGVRIYGTAGVAPIVGADETADRLVAMACGTVDVPRMVEAAWRDGVRIFLEHGPRHLCSGWIDQILGERPHLAVPLDRYGADPVRQLAEAVAALVSAGVACDWRAFDRRLAALSVPSRAASAGRVLRFPAHPPAVVLPALPKQEAEAETMLPAPELPPAEHWRPLAAAADSTTLGSAVAIATPPGADGPSAAFPRGPDPVLGPATPAQSAAPAAAVSRPGTGVTVRPSVTDAAPGDPSPASTAASSSAPAATQVIAAMVDHHRRLVDVHRAYLRHQAELHAGFLGLLEAAFGRLDAVLDSSPPPASPPAIPSTPATGDGPAARSADRVPVVGRLAIPPQAPGPANDTWSPGPAVALPAELAPPAAETASRALRSVSTPLDPVAAPRFDRAHLEALAGGRISAVFGPRFAFQDGFRRQVRLPMPPLLLPDRVVSLEGGPCSMGRGVIVTETDVPPDGWYAHDGYVTPGILVECGQSDLLLISWLGIDAHNRGERVYRLLGCELTFHGAPPRAGETLQYRVQVDGHARHGHVRLFFFRYECTVGGRPVLSVREGRAGFFSDDELAASSGVVWDPATGEHRTDGPLDPCAVDCGRRAFDSDALDAFTAGRLADCFGPVFVRANSHVRPPRIPGGRLRLLDRVSSFEPRGGPWGRGYLRAETELRGDEWFFPCHFKDDPVMPGTLMLEGCVQAMAFYLSAVGFSLNRDGWRFEPVPEEPYRMICRGQVLPTSRKMVYEVFVEDVSAGPVPTLHADVLVTVDGLKVFHCRRMGVRLVPDWPLTSRPDLVSGHLEPSPVATVSGVEQGYPALLACAWGAPTAAFGEPYHAFDGPRRLPRLPGPPYLFVSRVLNVEGAPGRAAAGARAQVEYDIPPDAWYFAAGGQGSVPFCVLLEAALQPCGWLTAYMGVPLGGGVDLSFRNLQGTGTVHRELGPEAGILTTHVTATDISRVGDTVIESFHVECLARGEPAFTLDTVFGHFPEASLAQQVGLAPTEAESAAHGAPCNLDMDLRRQRAGFPKLAREPLLMLDRMTGWWPGAGRAGLGRARAEKRVDAGEWFFKAHFFQDPVQPGSLGIEAMLQLLQFQMLHAGMADGLHRPRFQSLAPGEPLVWTYRGQVVPENAVVVVELELTAAGRDARGAYARADGTLWVDDKLIYRATDLSMRLAGDPAGEPVEVLDPDVDVWLGDHRPTFTVPVLPFMSLLDRMASAATGATGRPVVEMRRAEVRRWVRFDAPRSLRVQLSPAQDSPDVLPVRVEEESENGWETVATAEVQLADAYPEAGEAALPPLQDGRPAEDPYVSGALPHGPSFQLLCSLTKGSNGASAVLDAASRGVPFGCLNQGLLDAATHAIPHDALSAWLPDVPDDRLAYPLQVSEVRFYGPPPREGRVVCEVRADGFEGGPRLPAFRLQLMVEGRLWVALRLVEVLLPKGPLGRLDPRDRVAFLRDRRVIPGAGLSTETDGETRLDRRDVLASDWLPGTVAAIYRATGGGVAELTRLVAVKDHVARRAGVHPAEVCVDGERVFADRFPLTAFQVVVENGAESVKVRDAAAPHLNLDVLRSGWRRLLGGTGPLPSEDVFLALAERFVRRLELTAAETWAPMAGRGRLYLSNHQAGIESPIFAFLAGSLGASPVVSLVATEHRQTWLGRLVSHLTALRDVDLPPAMLFFERANPADILRLLKEMRRLLAAGCSLLVHMEGTPAPRAGRPVSRLSTDVIELAVAAEAPIVPVRFSGGMPAHSAPEPLEFPLGYGTQDYHVGRPIAPEELRTLPLAERRTRVREAIHSLGPRVDQPHADDPDLRAEADAWAAATGATHPHAVVWAALCRLSAPGPTAELLLDAARSGHLRLPADENGRWLAGLARPLFGPRGPRVEMAERA